MKKILIFLCFLISINAFSQITLTGTSYSQNFDNLSSGLPSGWNIYSLATDSTKGTTASLVNVPGTTTSWTSISGNFRNAASQTERVGNETPANQQTFTNRALAVRQTGSLGDPGAAFVLELNNTTDFENFSLNFLLQNLDPGSARTVKWRVDYGLGTNPTKYIALNTTPSTLNTGGTTAFGATSVSVNFPIQLNNYTGKVTIRIITIQASTGSGNRPTTGIDDFSLSYQPIPNVPKINASTSGFNQFIACTGQPSDIQKFVLNAYKLSEDVSISAPSDFEMSTSESGPYSNPLIISKTGTNVPNTDVFIRLNSVNVGTVSGNLTFNSLNANSINIPLNGNLSGTPTITTGVSSLSISTCPTAPSSYKFLTLTGLFMSGDVSVEAPAGYKVSISAFDGPWLKSVVFSNSNCKFNNTVYVRLDSVVTGSYNGNLKVNSAGAAEKLVTLTGNISDLSSASNQTISYAKNTTSLASQVQVGGRVTAILGTTIYLQDPSAGIAIYNPKLASAVSLGDSVWVVGTRNDFNGQKQLSGYVCYKIINVPRLVPAAKLIDFSTYSLANEGLLVKLNNIRFEDTTFVLIANNNYIIKENGSIVTKEIRIDFSSEVVGDFVPNDPFTITGVLGYYQNTSGSTQTYQLYPRIKSDFTPETVKYQNLSQKEMPLDSTLEVMTWNIEWFGNTNILNGPSNKQLQFENAKIVIQTISPDILVLEEISNIANFNNFKAQLTEYSGSCSPYGSNMPNGLGEGSVGHPMPLIPFPTVEDGNQRICLLYKTSIVSQVSEKVLMREVLSLPAYPSGFDNFWASGRYPYMWVLDATINGHTKRFHVVGIHAKANTAPVQTSYDRRKYDVNVLKDTLDAQYPNANILMLGDFNDDVDETVASGVTSTLSTYASFENDPINYRTISKPLSLNYFRTYLAFQNVIDHITISNELFGNYLKGSADVALPFKYINSYSSSTSDHIPVVARFNLKPCESTVIVGNDISLDTYKIVSESIIGSSKILLSQKVLFDAGQSINLSPGFEVAGNSVFTAKVGGCSNF